jgi:cell division protease FtsH
LLETEVIFKEDLEEIFGKRPFQKEETEIVTKKTKASTEKTKKTAITKTSSAKKTATNTKTKTKKSA